MLSPDGQSWCLLDGGGGDDGATAPHAVVLTGAGRDQVGGLLDLRGGAPINLYATPAVFEQLTQVLPVLPVLQQYCGVQWHLIAVGGDRRRTGFTIAQWPTLKFTAITLDANATGERIALAVQDASTGRRLFVLPALALGLTVIEWLQDADCVLLSGPLPQAAWQATQWFDCLADLPAVRKVLMHCNSEQAPAAALANCGIELACAGLEIEL